jgi:hypothetical protein
MQLKIKNYLPENFDLEFPSWSRRATLESARQEYGIETAVRMMGDCLKRWGFTPKGLQKGPTGEMKIKHKSGSMQLTLRQKHKPKKKV